jgi:hypothetical protein
VAWYVEALVSAAAASAVSLVMARVLSRRNASAREIAETGEAVMEYSRSLRRLPLAGSVFWIGLSIFLAFAVPPPSEQDAPILAVVVVLVVLSIVVLTIEMWGATIRISRHGIERRSPWRGRLYLLWQEVDRVTYSPSAQWFTVRGPRGTIHVHELVDGLSDFATVVLGHVRPEAYRGAEGKLRGYAPR